MDRTLALQLHGLYKLEKEYGRPVYAGELGSHQVCSMHQCDAVIEDLLHNHAIEEVTVRGSNAYTVTNVGRAHMESYLDIKREM